MSAGSSSTSGTPSRQRRYRLHHHLSTHSMWSTSTICYCLFNALLSLALINQSTTPLLALAQQLGATVSPNRNALAGATSERYPFVPARVSQPAIATTTTTTGDLLYGQNNNVANTFINYQQQQPQPKSLKFTLTAGKYWKFHIKSNSLHMNFNKDKELRLHRNISSTNFIIDDDGWFQYNHQQQQLFAWPSLNTKPATYYFVLLPSGIDFEADGENILSNSDVVANIMIELIRPHYTGPKFNIDQIVDHKFSLDYLHRHSSYPLLLNQIISIFETLNVKSNTTSSNHNHITSSTVATTPTSSLTSPPSALQQPQHLLTNRPTANKFSEHLLIDSSYSPDGELFSITWSTHPSLINNTVTPIGECRLASINDIVVKLSSPSLGYQSDSDKFVIYYSLEAPSVSSPAIAPTERGNYALKLTLNGSCRKQTIIDDLGVAPSTSNILIGLASNIDDEKSNISDRQAPSTTTSTASTTTISSGASTSTSTSTSSATKQPAIIIEPSLESTSYTTASSTTSVTSKISNVLSVTTDPTLSSSSSSSPDLSDTVSTEPITATDQHQQPASQEDPDVSSSTSATTKLSFPIETTTTSTSFNRISLETNGTSVPALIHPSSIQSANAHTSATLRNSPDQLAPQIEGSPSSTPNPDSSSTGVSAATPTTPTTVDNNNWLSTEQTLPVGDRTTNDNNNNNSNNNYNNKQQRAHNAQMFLTESSPSFGQQPRPAQQHSIEQSKPQAKSFASFLDIQDNNNINSSMSTSNPTTMGPIGPPSIATTSSSHSSPSMPNMTLTPIISTATNLPTTTATIQETSINDDFIGILNEVMDYLVSVAVPASIIVGVILIASILVAIFSLCLKRKKSKQFEVGNRFKFRYGSERRQFLKNSSKPVILEADQKSLSMGGTPQHKVQTNPTNDDKNRATYLKMTPIKADPKLSSTVDATKKKCKAMKNGKSYNFIGDSSHGTNFFALHMPGASSSHSYDTGPSDFGGCADYSGGGDYGGGGDCGGGD